MKLLIFLFCLILSAPGFAEKYVIKEGNDLKIYFHSGVLPANIEAKVQAIAPSDCKTTWGDAVVLKTDPSAPYGKMAIYDESKLKVIKQQEQLTDDAIAVNEVNRLIKRKEALERLNSISDVDNADLRAIIKDILEVLK